MIIRPFFFAQKTVTGSSSLDILQLYAFPQLEHLQPNVFLQQDRAPPHWSLDVWRAINATFSGCWIGRDWPPRSPDITSLDFFLWGYMKDRIYATEVQDLRNHWVQTVEAVGTIIQDMLQRT
jgi:hypothetical protein